MSLDSKREAQGCIGGGGLEKDMPWEYSIGGKKAFRVELMQKQTLVGDQ